MHSEQDKAKKAGCGLVKSGGDTPLFLEMTDEAFDARPQRIERFAQGRCPACRTS
jgi:hypothetical protein